MLDAMENFESFSEDVLNLDFVDPDRFYMDVGKEICPRSRAARAMKRRYIAGENAVKKNQRVEGNGFIPVEPYYRPWKATLDTNPAIESTSYSGRNLVSQPLPIR